MALPVGGVQVGYPVAAQRRDVVPAVVVVVQLHSVTTGALRVEQRAPPALRTRRQALRR